MKNKIIFITLLILAIIIIVTSVLLQTNKAWSTYYNTNYNFTIKYPSEIFKQDNFSCVIPVSEGKNITDDSAVVFKHTFPFEWSDDADNSQQEMTDMSIELCVVDGNYQDLVNYYDSLTPVTVDKHEAIKIEMGAEGAGVELYYFPLDNNKSLIIDYHYISSFIDQRLTEEKQYITIEKQKEILRQMLESLKLN
ncbi:MAG: hypothetical protein WA057_06710 [Candidatus Magasanikiibacteriota bacterium]